MAIDVSIYTLRVKDGYLSTTTGGTLRSLGSSPYSSSQSGGTASGVVRTTGDQRVVGEKYWDASAHFIQDISIGGDIFAKGVLPDTSTNKVVFIDTTSGRLSYADASFGTEQPFVTLTVTGDASIKGDLYVDGSTFYEDVVIIDSSVYNWTVENDASIGNNLYVQNVDILTTLNSKVEQTLFDSSILALWSYEAIQDASIAALEASIGTSMDYAYVDGSLSLRDASIAWLRAYDVIQDASISDLYDKTSFVDLTISNNLTVGNDVSISGDLYVDGSTFYEDVVIIDTSVYNWTVENDASIGGNLWVDGDINGGLFGDSVVIANNLTVGNDVSIVNNLYVDGDTSILGDLTVQNALDISDWYQTKAIYGTPDSSGSGVMGDMQYDSSYLYVCTSTNKWIRFLGEWDY